MNRRHTLFLIICALIIVQGQMVSAETWVENFSDDNLDSWKEYDEHHDGGIWAPKKVIWQTKNGKLDVWIDPPPTPGIFEIFPLEFVGFPIMAKELNVKVKILETSRFGIGILIGQYDERGGVIGDTFHFLNSSFIPLNKTPFRNGVIQTPPLHTFEITEIAHQVDSDHLPLEEMEISFNNGHFKFLSKDDLLTEFKCPQMTKINCIGIIAYVERGAGAIGEFVLDDFILSAPTFYDVSPKSKAAVLWGELKRQ
ncbi:hypothetical protein C6501_06215 [Candidatus Poribacteria bacterium]|nr:MAG: hypothetical protein C6501_06215 [Candidatus Poribacteria bacterium]